jgi:hypothetical protein
VFSLEHSPLNENSPFSLVIVYFEVFCTETDAKGMGALVSLSNNVPEMVKLQESF